MTSPVLFEQIATQDGHALGVITLNSEKTLNSLTLEMVELMLEKLLHWQTDAKIAAVFIQGAGEKAFCAGGDVQALRQSSVQNPGGPCDYAETFFAREYRLDYLLHNYGKPTIVWGHGIVMGGGLGIFAGCSHRIATERTRIAMPEVTIALFPDVGGSYFLNRMPGHCGRFLALSAASINGADSLYACIANFAISQSHKPELLEQLQALDWSSSLISTELTALFENFQRQSSADIPPGNLETHQTMIDKLCQGDDVNLIAQRFAELETEDRWLQRAQSGLAGGSPLAVKWIFRQLQLCEGLSLKEVFEKEILLATNIVRHSEFAEGVRALLVDKDHAPNWQYKQLSDVTDDVIAPFFQAPWPQNPLRDL
ncbi:enoyl-CoA hydratase/isomerase family protein [Simiduia curdlanivorans]|uniref:3-hydroxyisobutyryl-CoA hydrolase n=1 Tax=Simiduia curdlanivorans TaxID=1492769 RepID=A0ABV8V314_9GAMM|nr:enoyl-CoA hydratase/isomerase family protein [Simiduia curdlanivorans]MDN3640958.1 enoyl-CoA hydratase/isomerase family protein [Simiduia curdlanivorans]